MFLDDFPIVIWFVRKVKHQYFLYDSQGIHVMTRNENRKNEIYQYCADNGIDVQNEF
jgi:hypothetical protein